MGSEKSKRKLELLVLSDLHLGTYGCHAKELLQYLKSINPETIILNGDIIDIWQFSKRYWPKSHMKVLKHIIGWISKGKKVYYITGNHDEMLRKFVPFQLGSFQLENKVVLNLDGKSAWFFHGDVFDITMKHSKWLAKLGAIGYDTLILINRFVNFISKSLGKGKLSLSKKIKDSVKSAVKFINDFEETAANIAIDNKFDYVVCGHIHQPIKREVVSPKGSIVYLNSGDWIENLTSLEYNNGNWVIYKHSDKEFEKDSKEEEEESDKTNEEIFNELFSDFTKKKQ